MNFKGWTANEEEKLERLYPDPHITFEEITKALPGRSPNAIRLRANRLGLKRPVLEVPTCPICGHIIKQETRP
jgi:hypothetical protein